MHAPSDQIVRIWDLPTRLFHWGLVISVAVCWVSASLLDNAMTLHLYAGYTALTLLIFRVFWGFIGSSTARFDHFVTGIRPALDYTRTLLQTGSSSQVGHNPLGGWSALALLTLALVTTISGLFANDAVQTWGPLAHFVSADASDSLSDVHRIAFNILAWLIGLHVAAVLFYRFYKRDNLIVPMITGNKQLASSPGHLVFASNLRALGWLALAAAITSVIVLKGG